MENPSSFQNRLLINAISLPDKLRIVAFSDTLLEDMVVEFNRYNRSPQLRLQGVPTGTYRFAGIFDAADPQSPADLLSREPDLVIEKRENEIVIRHTTAGEAASPAAALTPCPS